MFFGKNKEELGLEESLAALKAERDTLSEKVQSELHQVKTKINHWQNALAYREKKIESVNNAIAQYNSATAEKKTIFTNLTEELSAATADLRKTQERRDSSKTNFDNLTSWIETLNSQISELERDGVSTVLRERLDHLFPHKEEEPSFIPPTRQSDTGNE